jgi:hypothetical protein
MTRAELSTEIRNIKDSMLLLEHKVEALRLSALDFWSDYPDQPQPEDYFGTDFRIRD